MNFSDYWAAVIPILVSITIVMNYRRSVHGWLLGAIIQAAQVVFAVSIHKDLLLLSAVPMVVFLLCWIGALRDKSRSSRGCIRDDQIGSEAIGSESGRSSQVS